MSNFQMVETTNKIIELEDFRKVWLHGECHCVSCGHQWYSVMHVNDVGELECPKCHKMTGGLLK